MSETFGRTGWWTRSVGRREELDYHRAYVPDPFEVQAVRNHFIRSKFEINSKQTSFGFLGNDVINGGTVTVYKTTERITGVEKKTDLPMATSAVMTYRVGAAGIILRSEAESRGSIGNDQFFLRITGVWELDPSIAPCGLPAGCRRSDTPQNTSNNPRKFPTLLRIAIL
jgi:hypothetical protein